MSIDQPVTPPRPWPSGSTKQTGFMGVTVPGVAPSRAAEAGFGSPSVGSEEASGWPVLGVRRSFRRESMLAAFHWNATHGGAGASCQSGV